MKPNKNPNIIILIVGALCVIGACFLQDDYYANMLRSCGIAWIVSGIIYLKRCLYYEKPEHQAEYEARDKEQRINLHDERKIMLRQKAAQTTYQIMFFLLLGLSLLLALLRVEWWITAVIFLLFVFQWAVGVVAFRYYEKRL